MVIKYFGFFFTVKLLKYFLFSSMDVHPSKEMVASAQKAGRTRKTQAHIRIWSPETLYTLYIVGNGEFEEGVSTLAFSQLVCNLFWSISCTPQCIE